jgi:hypothetical protein
MIRFDCTGWLMTKVRGLRPGHRALALLQGAGLATLLLACAYDAGADSLGRWFFSTEERRTLDELRDAGEEPKPPPKSGEKAVAPVVDVISFDGKVERSGGGSTIWVNGRPVFTGNRTAEGIRVRSSRGTDGETRFELPPSDSGTTQFSLKAGQKVAVAAHPIRHRQAPTDLPVTWSRLPPKRHRREASCRVERPANL